MEAYIFPGQGSQFPGMGKDLFDQYEIAKKLFNQANEILGFDLSKIIFEGCRRPPTNECNPTRNLCSFGGPFQSNGRQFQP